MQRAGRYGVMMSDGLSRAIKVVRELHRLQPSMTLTCALTLLIAARYEGCTMGFLLRQTGATKSSLSRYVQELSEVRGFGVGRDGRAAPILGRGLLLTRSRPENRVEKEVFLTMRGRALVAVIEEIMRQP